MKGFRGCKREEQQPSGKTLRAHAAHFHGESADSRRPSALLSGWVGLDFAFNSESLFLSGNTAVADTAFTFLHTPAQYSRQSTVFLVLSCRHPPFMFSRRCHLRPRRCIVIRRVGLSGDSSGIPTYSSVTMSCSATQSVRRQSTHHSSPFPRPIPWLIRAVSGHTHQRHGPCTAKLPRVDWPACCRQIHSAVTRRCTLRATKSGVMLALAAHHTPCPGLLASPVPD